MLLDRELSWPQLAAASVSAVMLPLILHRIFFHKKAHRHSSPASSGSLDDYITKVRTDGWQIGGNRLYLFVDHHGMSELDAKFQVAVDFVAAKAGNRMTNEQRLTLYAFYKQALFGTCTVEKPSAADFVGSAKWESWRALGEMDSEVAKQQYLEWVKDLFEDFDVTGSKKRRASSASGSSKVGREELSLGNSISTAGVVSMPTVDMTTEEWQVKEDPFHFASTGDVEKVSQALEKGFDINAKARITMHKSSLKVGECKNLKIWLRCGQQDDEGRTMLHWAVDRSQTAVAELLLKREAAPNLQDEDGMTALHYATSCEHDELAKLLVEHGAFTDMEDNDGETPLSYATTDELASILSNGKSQAEE